MRLRLRAHSLHSHAPTHTLSHLFNVGAEVEARGVGVQQNNLFERTEQEVVMSAGVERVEDDREVPAHVANSHTTKRVGGSGLGLLGGGLE